MEPDLERISTPEATKKRRHHKKGVQESARREQPVFVPFCASDIADEEVGGETVQCLGVHYLVEFAESLQSAPAVCSARELASHRHAWMSRHLRRRDREAQDSRLGRASASQSGQFCKLHVTNVFHFADRERRCTLRKQDAFPGNQIVQLQPVSEDCRQHMRTHGAPDELLKHRRSVRFWKVPLALLDSLKGGELVLAVPQGICRNMGFRTFSEEPTAESAPFSVPSLALQSANPAEAGDTEEAPAGGGAGDDLADLLWDVQVSTRGKAIRRHPMTEILMGKLCYSLSSTADVAEVVQTVLRMMDVVAENTNQEDVNPSKSHVRTILVKLDCLHSLSRRVFAKPGQPDRRTVRFLSADSSPQANYDYFLVTEELMTRSSVLGVPVDSSGEVDPWAGFTVERRTMVVTTIARGESSAALKTMRVLRIVCLENTAAALPQYRDEVRGFLSDQGTERLICKYPLDTAAKVKEAVRGLARDTGAAATHERVRALPFFPKALEIPGSLHVVFNTLEAVVKSVPEFEVLHKQLLTLCRLLTHRSYQEVVENKMLHGCTAADKQALHSFRDSLLEWRWDSLRRVLSQWAPLRLVLLRHWRPEEFGSEPHIAKQVSDILEDGMHGWMIMWAGKFAEAATHIAHWIEGCFCHEAVLTSVPASKRRKTMMEESGSPTCCWKGKRLPQLACGKMTDLIHYFTSQAQTAYISEMLAAPADVRARVAAIDALATEQLRVVLEQKFAYAQTIPWVVCAAFGGYTGIPWDRCKAAISEGFRQYSEATTGGAFVDAVSFRAFSGLTLESRQLKAFASSELPLHRYAEAWIMVQEYAFCSLAERGTERQHSEIRNAARRGQRYAGPAVVASRKREKQVVAMIDDPEQLQFLVAHWRDRHIWRDLLEHCSPKQTVRRMTVVQRLAKVYAYHPEQHFMDVSEEATAQAVYQKALLDASAAARTEDSVPLKLGPAPHQIVHFLKSHLRNGSLVSLGEEAFHLALRYTPRQPQEEADVPCKEMLSQDLWESLRTEMVVPAVSLDPYFFTVLDARPEQRKDVRADRGRSKSSILVMLHTHVRVLSDTEVRVQSSGNRQELLELASFCNQARMQVFMHSCRVWTPKASDVSLHVLTAGARRQPDLVPIPDFIQDHEPAACFSNQLRRRQADMQVVEHGPDRVRISAEAVVLLNAEEDLLHELLRHGALGGRYVSVDDLSEFNAAAVQRLQQHGILSGEEGAFGDLTLSVTSSLQLLPECTWSEPLAIWDLSHFFLTRGKVALTSKIEYFRLLFKQGWKPRCDDESELFEWHYRDATAELPAQGVGMSLPYLRCLLTSVLLWQKPGKLERILVNGPMKYYEYLMSKADLSAVANLTAEEIRRKFAGVRKASATDAVDLALEHDPEQEDGYEVLAAAAAGVAAGSEVPQSDPELLQLNMPKESSRDIVVNGRSCQVYFDNYTHASGQLRAFVQCTRHVNCRLYVFVHKVRGKGRAVAYLQRWLQEASAYPGLNGDEHKQYKPPDTEVDALLLAQAVAQ